MNKIAGPFLCGILLSACSSGEDPASFPPHLILSVVDSIGVEFGDPEEVFGDVNGAYFLDESTFVVFDKAYQNLRTFDSEGNHILTRSFQGNGPLECQYASSISFLDTLFGVFEFDKPPGCVIFDGSVTPVSSVTLHESSALMNPGFLGNSSIIGSVGWMAERNGVPGMGIEVCSWDVHSGIRERVFFSNSVDLTSYGSGYGQFVSLEHCVESLRDSLVFVVPDLRGFEILVYSAEGAILDTLCTVHERDLRSPEEIELEMIWRKLRDGGMGDWSPSDREPGITQLQVQDSQGLLWACHGSYFEPEFDVYGMDGGIEFTCSCSGLPTSEMLRFGINDHGFLAYTMQPSGYPRVYIMELVDEQR